MRSRKNSGSNRLSAAVGVVLTLLLLGPALAGASAQPGTTVRDAFGPQAGPSANRCRGACGGDCPATCETTVTYECRDDGRLERVTGYDCGTHQGCRVHDDCLDACLAGGGDVGACSSQCDADIMTRYGVLDAGSWLLGKGPYDARITFEYTRDAEGAPVPAFRCPDGSSRQCGASVGCLAGSSWVEPIFDTYRGVDGMQVAGFVAGSDCGNAVCEPPSPEIDITGTETCPGGACSRFGMEFDYTNANPAAPLECTTSTSGGGSDFVGDLLKQGADSMEARGTMPDPESEDGMQALMGVFGKVLTAGDSPDDVNISVAPLGADGKPIESQRVGSTPAGAPLPIPTRVDLPGSSGHLFVPMYQLSARIEKGEVKERRVRCTHQGVPVLDTTFRLVGGDQPEQRVVAAAETTAVDCCSCAITADATYTDPRLPCSFAHPAHWQAQIGHDGLMLSAVVVPSPQHCTSPCPNGGPAMSVIYGTDADTNADTMLSIWPMAMPEAGSARCGASDVKFFSPPGAEETGQMGAVRYFVEIDGAKYGGTAQFTCGEPGGWMQMRDAFIESFGDNPESTFPE